MKKLLFVLFTIISVVGFSGCEGVNDERIPNMPVSISLSTQGEWNTYGVTAFGASREFIIGKTPKDFNYKSGSATGFGGVILIVGHDLMPLAYDLSCPVERSREVLLKIEQEQYHAVCNKCGSVYDVTMADGSPLSGPAALKNNRYVLKKYQVYPTISGGYDIRNY